MTTCTQDSRCPNAPPLGLGFRQKPVVAATPKTKFDPTKPVQTRDGRPARILCTDRKSAKYPIIALVNNEVGEDEVVGYTALGELYMNPTDTNEYDLDLVNVPERTVKYVSIYENATVMYNTLESARARVFPDICGIVKLTLEYDKLTGAEVIDG